MAISLLIIGHRSGSLEFDQVRGVGHKYLLSAAGLFVALLSISGFPLTAGFPIHLALWQELRLVFPLAGNAAIIGSFGLLIGALRAVSGLVIGSGNEPWNSLETLPQRLLISVSLALIILIGIVPQAIYPVLFRMAAVFLSP
jgi:formate hydrogenlyase subunit 3/multisubunit Na+/H+ antiporter MnhD subunit